MLKNCKIIRNTIIWENTCIASLSDISRIKKNFYGSVTQLHKLDVDKNRLCNRLVDLQFFMTTSKTEIGFYVTVRNLKKV